MCALRNSYFQEGKGEKSFYVVRNLKQNSFPLINLFNCTKLIFLLIKYSLVTFLVENTLI